MNTTTFHKTLLALVISGVCASTLGADLSIRGDSDTSAQGSAQIQSSEAAASGSNQNQAGLEVAVNESAASNMRSQTENSVQSVAALGGTIKNEATTQAQAVGAAVSTSIESQSTSDLNVSTLDGIAIDLSGSSDNAIAAQLTSTLDASVAQSAESGIGLGEAALATSINLLNNTTASVEEAGNAVDVSAAAESSTDAAAAAQFDEASIGSVESATDSSTTSSLVGGLL